MESIHLENMEFYAFHGCHKEERIVGGHFMVDLYVEADLSKPMESDDLNDTINYQAIYRIVKEQMSIKSHLLEHLAKRILDILHKEFPNIKKSFVKISKLNPPVGGKIEKVSVVSER